MNKPEPQPEGKADLQPEGKATPPSDPTPQIAKRAYEIHEERGHQSDPAAQDWEQAKREIQKDDAKATPQPEVKAEPKPETKTAPASKKKKVLIAVVILLVVLAAVAIGFGLGRYWGNSKKQQNRLVLYGNVDLRQVDLAFNNNERITEVLAQEGDRVKRGQLLARLDTSRLKPEAAEAKADLVNAKQQWSRLTALAELTTGRAVSQQDLDSAKAALDIAQARLTVSDRKLADAELVSPCDAVVRSRLLEPGEMVSPQRPVFNLAITDPKWVRAYISESDLGKVHEGMKASISTDSFPNRTIPGWVGFISSVAEFTPKAVETADLRPNLVYEIRVFVKDPQDEMRLGMPATVTLELNPPAQSQP
jgi:RND family efflux transporter MFP subunit